MLLGDIVIKPDNSLLRQARNANFHPGAEDTTGERNITVNGDGFGLAWYVSEPPKKGACCCKFLTPAWSNLNLRNLGDYVTSPVIIAHVRAASSGRDHLEDVAVSAENCHPFKYKQWTFVHNGAIPSFKRIKRAMVMLLKDECFNDISGSTDSECIFALFLSLLPDRDVFVTVDVFMTTVNLLISTILELLFYGGVTEPCSLNLGITDGINLVATRFRNGTEDPPSLYYNYGSEFECLNDGQFHSKNRSTMSEIVISSAPLSGDSSTIGQWQLIHKDHMLICRGEEHDLSRVVSVELRPIEAAIGRGIFQPICPLFNKARMTATYPSKFDMGLSAAASEAKLPETTSALSFSE